MRLITALLLAAFSAPAVAADAYTTAIVNLRAGPGIGFPRVATLPADHVVRVHGCLPEWEWCDVSFRGARGWASGGYLEFLLAEDRLAAPEYGRRGDLPAVRFDPDAYWDRWYSDRPWYGEREAYVRRWEGRAEVEIDRTSDAVRPDRFATGSIAREALPPGLARKGRGFCPPGQRKKGRC